MSDLILNLNQNQNQILPQELMVEILLRLPVKSLLRFRSVSKSWLSIISDPLFAESHFDLAAAPTHRLLYAMPFGNAEARSIDLDASLRDDSPAVNRVLLFPPSFCPQPSVHPQYVQIFGSCRGFVLLDTYPHLFLWNPTTGVHKRIPYPSFASRLMEGSFRFGYAEFKYGFGYDASTDDYLVVIASYNNDAEWNPVFEFFALRTNSWEKFEFHYLIFDESASPVNGALHWSAIGTCTVIIAFDLTKRNLLEIPLPLPLANRFIHTELSVLEGCVSLYCLCDDGTSLEMWVMKEYNVQSSWTKSICLSMVEFPIHSLWFTNGGEIVKLDMNGGIFKLNHKGELLEHLPYCHDSDGRFADMYVESLLSLPSDSGKARDDDQQ